jgi:hypothetical protein
VKDELMLWRIKRRAAVTAASTKREDIFPHVLCSQVRSIVQKEIRDRGGGAIVSTRRARSPINRAAGTGSQGSPDQLASRSFGNLVTNHFGLIAHATDAAGEWDADALVD